MTDAKPDVGALVKEIEFTMPPNKDVACGYDELLDRCRTALLALQAENKAFFAVAEQYQEEAVTLQAEVAALRIAYARMEASCAALSADMPSEGVDAAIAFASLKAERDRLTQENERLAGEMAAHNDQCKSACANKRELGNECDSASGTPCYPQRRCTTCPEHGIIGGPPR